MIDRCQVEALRLARRLAVVLSATISSGAWAQVNLDLSQGWNLVGNGYYASADVASITLNKPVVTVWKWLPAVEIPTGGIPAGAKWAFYAPSLANQGGTALQDYANSKGYDILTTINPGEGFWVNAGVAMTLNLHTTTPAPIPTAAFQAGGLALPSGWSLIAVGDNPVPREFANGIADAKTCPGTTIFAALCPGLVAATSLTTLWAWSATQVNWYFYAPSLDNLGTLAGYRGSKGYLDFTGDQGALGSVTGFWVNRPGP